MRLNIEAIGVIVPVLYHTSVFICPFPRYAIYTFSINLRLLDRRPLKLRQICCVALPFIM
jgi:hypothetical protein